MGSHELEVGPTQWTVILIPSRLYALVLHWKKRGLYGTLVQRSGHNTVTVVAGFRLPYVPPLMACNSMAEYSAVNRAVGGSNPPKPAIF